MSNEEFQKIMLDTFKKVNEKLDKIDNQVEENTQILKALEHKSEVNKAEHDKMFIDIAKLTGNVKEIKDDMSTIEVIAAKNNLDIAKLKAVK